jgi:hypothetical protein
MTWKRLEGGHIDPELTEGMSARIADPLWLLARQWQVGEFRGEDAATPVLIDGTVVAAPVTEYWVDHADGRHSIVRTEGGLPLETLAEREPIAEGPANVGLRLESGAALLRRLSTARASAAVLDAFRSGYAFVDPPDGALDPVGDARLALLARRSLDGAAVRSALAAAGGDPAALPELVDLAPGPKGRAAAAVATWDREEAELFRDAAADQPSAWSARRLEYRFGVSATVPRGSIELVAPEYPGGQLDWYHFDVVSMPDPEADLKPVAGLVRKSLTSLPTPLEFAGMPASRWWEFEDRDVYFGDLAGGPEDLARSVVASFATVAGDDWFIVPCSLPAGSLAQVTRLRVLDDFGTWTNVPAAAARDGGARGRPWRFFELSGDPGPAGGQAPLLFLPPIVDSTEQSRPLELVDFRRDEMANLAWAIERRVESDAGRPVDREAGRNLTPDTGGSAGDAWRFRLSSDVPDHWVPLVPVRIEADEPQVVLRRGVVALNADPQPAKGRILEPEHPFVLHEEEIPVGGLQVSRRYQLARGADGRVHLWVGRKKAPSGGRMRRTPLRFDFLRGWPGDR